MKSIVLKSLKIQVNQVVCRSVFSEKNFKNNDMKFFKLILSLAAFVALSCTPPATDAEKSPVPNGNTEAKMTARDSTQTVFWQELQKLCGKAYQGTIAAGPANDTVFAGKQLTMHVRQCGPDLVKIPFFVGNDSSRTWVLTLDESGILLKHDHRHSDGSPDEVTMYGGKTANFGAADRQVFPADQETADMLPAAIGNVWWVDLVPGEHFTYNLRRVNTDRLFSVRFDLRQEGAVPGKPWGWVDE